MERYQHRLGGYLRRLIGDDATADALQDVWLAIWRGLPRLREAIAFPAWAFRIARDRAFRELRRRGLPTLPADESIPTTDAGEFTSEDAEEVRSHVDHLPPVQKDVLLLRFIEGLSYEEIAGVIGVPVGTVAVTPDHAKQALKTILEREDSNYDRLAEPAEMATMAITTQIFVG